MWRTSLMKQRAVRGHFHTIAPLFLLAGCEARAIAVLSEANDADSGAPSPTLAPAQCPPIPGIAIEASPIACGPPLAALFDDFEGGFPPNWIPFDDGTGTRQFRVEQGGPLESRYAGHLVADGFTTWGAGVAAAFTCLTDARSFQGVRFHMRAGAPGRFFVQVTTPQTIEAMNGGLCTENCNDHYTYLPKLSVPGDEWYECRVRFADLAQFGFSTPVALDLCRFSSFQFYFTEVDQPVDAWIDDVAFVQDVPSTGCTQLANTGE
jgi:hypothetical protein